MNFNEMFPLKVFINLDKRTDRLKTCQEKEFPKLGIVPIRKSGIIYTGTNNSFFNGTIGCLLSHYAVMQSALCLDTNYFVFEDDLCIINDNVKDILDQCCNELNNIQWDIFYMGGNILRPHHKTTEHLSRLSHCQSTVAFGVNKTFLQTLINYIDLQHIDRPIDVLLADTIIPRHSAFISIPQLIIQRNDFSDIENTNVNYSSYLENRYWENFRDKDENINE